MADEKPKEGVKTENNDHINLKVAGQDGSVVQFKIKRHTPLSKLMKAYCERQRSRNLTSCPSINIPILWGHLHFTQKIVNGHQEEEVEVNRCWEGLSMRQIRFRFDGQPINETDTPAQLEMEDEDTIDVFQQQTGGVY
uniref:Small ubiquitin like modifier 2 n=1 Tax=Equus asinus TaxID=9793 RepID=A0A9L0KCV0_EQUAS